MLTRHVNTPMFGGVLSRVVLALLLQLFGNAILLQKNAFNASEGRVHLSERTFPFRNYHAPQFSPSFAKANLSLQTQKTIYFSWKEKHWTCPFGNSHAFQKLLEKLSKEETFPDGILGILGNFLRAVNFPYKSRCPARFAHVIFFLSLFRFAFFCKTLQSKLLQTGNVSSWYHVLTDPLFGCIAHQKKKGKRKKDRERYFLASYPFSVFSSLPPSEKGELSSSTSRPFEMFIVQI